MTREEMNFIGGMNMCDEISNEAYKKIMCHCEELEPCDDCISRQDVMEIIEWAYDECKIDGYTDYCEMRDMVKGLPSVKPKAGSEG